MRLGCSSMVERSSEVLGLQPQCYKIKTQSAKWRVLQHCKLNKPKKNIQVVLWGWRKPEGAGRLQPWPPRPEEDMEKVPCLKSTQMHEERSTLIIHRPSLPYVPSGCPRPWKEAVRAALHLLDSEESALGIGSRHPTFTADGNGRGQEPWRQTWVFPFGWPGLRHLPS